MNTLIKLKSLFKYGNGYRLEYFNEEGKLKTKKLKAKTKEEAQTMATNLLLELNVNLIEEKHLTEQKQLEHKYSGVRRHVIGTEIVNTHRLLLDVFDEFFMLKQHLSKRSFDDYKRLKDLLYKYNFRWEQLEISNLIKFQKGLENTLSHHYICNHMKLFMVFIKYCYECNHISNNTYGTVCMNIFRHERMKKTPSIPKDVYNNIIEVAKDDDDFHLLLELLYITGSRPNEIIKLDKDCLIPNTNIIRIYQFKTKKYIQIPLDNEFYEKCRTHFLLSDTEFAFHHGHKARYYNNKWNAICEKLGLRKLNKGKYENMFDLRQIRHTSLTEEYRKTNNKKAVSRKAGHTDEKTTSKYIDLYCHA